MKNIFKSFILFTLILCGSLFSNDSLEDMRVDYKMVNEKLPNVPTSFLDVLNSEELYTSISDTQYDNVNNGLYERLIQIVDVLNKEDSVRVMLQLQTEFYPEGLLESEQAVQTQRQNKFDLLVDIINNNFLDKQSILDSIVIYDSIPYISVEVTQENIWEVLSIPGIINIEIDMKMKPMLTESTSVINVRNAWTSGYTGSNRSVAILDSGVRSDHTDFTGKIVYNGCYSGHAGSTTCPNGSTIQLGGTSGTNCNNAYSGCDHGTHVASIAAGKNNGVAKGANILAFQVFSYSGGSILASNTDWTAALEKVLEVKDTYNVASVNMSLGGGSYTNYCDALISSAKTAIDNLKSVGIATVIATGNDGYRGQIAFPACISSAVAIGATTDTGIGFVEGYLGIDQVTHYSNHNNLVDLLAPGSTINAAISTSSSAYADKHGTSMATPHVAGAFAVLRQATDTHTVDQLVTILQNTGSSIPEPDTGISKKRIDVLAAIQSLGEGTLKVTILPTAVKYDGAQWSIDGGTTWNNSGVTLTLPVGTYTIKFKSVSHVNSSKIWRKPSGIDVTISTDGQNITKTGTYVEADKPSKFIVDYNGDAVEDILFTDANGRSVIYEMDGPTATRSVVTESGAALINKAPFWTYR